MKFVSRRSEFRLIIRPTDRIIDESRRPIIIPGEKVEFMQHQFNTEDQGLITYLLKHPLYGRDFTSEAGGDIRVIEKPNLVFDDGAEISGPKIVAGFPERSNRPIKIPEMIVGAVATVPAAQIAQPVQSSAAKALTKEEIEQIIDNKLNGFVDKITNMISPTYVKTRTFSCPYCHEQFPSGFAIGTHKKICPSRPTTE